MERHFLYEKRTLFCILSKRGRFTAVVSSSFLFLPWIEPWKTLKWVPVFIKKAQTVQNLIKNHFLLINLSANPQVKKLAQFLVQKTFHKNGHRYCYCSILILERIAVQYRKRVLKIYSLYEKQKTMRCSMDANYNSNSLYFHRKT